MSTYQQERRADRTAEAEQAREDRRLEVEARLEAQKVAAEARRRADEVKAEQRRADADAKAERDRKAVAEQRRQEQADRKALEAEKAAKKAAAAAKRAKRVAWLKANPATLFVAFVMVASIVPAVISQVGALSGASVNVALAALLAAMLEGGAWAVTFMGKQAEDAGRETRKYRIAGWLMAAAAASVNLWHGLEQYAAHPWVAFVLAGSSLFAFFIWDMKTHGSDGKTKAEKREAKARAKHAATRRSHHKDVAREADRLLSALPYGSITEEAAFAAAWRIRHGAEQGMTAAAYAATTNAKVQLGAAFELGEHVRPELLRTGMLAAALSPLPGRLADRLPVLGATVPVTAAEDATVSPLRPAKEQVGTQVPPAEKKRAAKPVPPRRRKGDTPAFHPAAKVAAAATARRATVVNGRV